MSCMYATIEEANAYAQSYYSSTNPLKVAWDALDDSDKVVLLNRAQQLIDQLPFTGQSVEIGIAFPREPHAETSIIRAREATIELAIRTLDGEAIERHQLQGQGVKSYKIGDLSETFITTGGYTGNNALAFSIVYPFLQTWLGGGFKICHTRIRR